MDIKKFPKKPADLWGGGSESQTLDAIVATAKSMKAAQELAKRPPKSKNKKGKP